MAKKKKEKIIYVDDGRTIADMSGISGGFKTKNLEFGSGKARFKEVFKTYIGAVKMMLLPMLVVIGALIFIYLLLTLLFWLM